jgi:ParB family transcriptional regulator, chromosome partitioning protein
MSRKNVFADLLTPDASDNASRAEPHGSGSSAVRNSLPSSAQSQPERRGGPLTHLSDMLADVRGRAARAEEIEAALSAGDRVVEIDPELIDPSKVGDRLPASKEEQDAFTESIAAYGQRVPGLVRPSKATPGRYVIVYGRRRLAAARTLGKAFLTTIAELDDETAFVVQGLENNNRKDLSFIERALYAMELSALGLSTNAIAAALKTAQPNVATMMGLVRKIPRDLIFAIGSCPSIGRPRWSSLQEALDGAHAAGAESAWREVIARREFRQAQPETRFEQVFRSVWAAAHCHEPDAAKPEAIADESGEVFATVRRKRTGAVVIEIAKPSPANLIARSDGLNFDRWLSARLAALRAQWRNGG